MKTIYPQKVMEQNLPPQRHMEFAIGADVAPMSRRCHELTARHRRHRCLAIGADVANVAGLLREIGISAPPCPWLEPFLRRRGKSPPSFAIGILLPISIVSSLPPTRGTRHHAMRFSTALPIRVSPSWGALCDGAIAPARPSALRGGPTPEGPRSVAERAG